MNSPRARSSIHDDEPPPSSWFPDVYFKNVDLRSLSQYGVCFLATTLYVIHDIKSSVT